MCLTSLIGKKVLSIKLNDDRNLMCIRTPEYDYIFHAEGDCCSSSWVEDLIHPDFITGEIVTGAYALRLPDGYYPDVEAENEKNKDNDDFVDTFGFALRSAKGQCDIILHNASNGYYDGWLECKGCPDYVEYHGWWSTGKNQSFLKEKIDPLPRSKEKQ